MKLKHQITIVNIIVFFAVLLPILFIPISNEELLGFETISKSDNGNHRSQAFYVINSNDEFFNLWKFTHSWRFCPPEPLSIDFTNTTVIAVYGGSTGKGASVEITKIILQDNKTIVYYKVELYVYSSPSSSYHMVKTRKLENKFYFIEI